MSCNICFEDIDNTNQELLTKCNHLFHKNCLIKIIYPKCPCCKSNITKLLNENGLNNKKYRSRRI